MWGGCRHGWRKTCQGQRHGVENDAAKAVARSGDISSGLRKESDGLRERERGEING